MVSLKHSLLKRLTLLLVISLVVTVTAKATPSDGSNTDAGQTAILDDIHAEPQPSAAPGPSDASPVDNAKTSTEQAPVAQPVTDTSEPAKPAVAVPELAQVASPVPVVENATAAEPAVERRLANPPVVKRQIASNTVAFVPVGSFTPVTDFTPPPIDETPAPYVAPAPVENTTQSSYSEPAPAAQSSSSAETQPNAPAPSSSPALPKVLDSTPNPSAPQVTTTPSQDALPQSSGSTAGSTSVLDSIVGQGGPPEPGRTGTASDSDQATASTAPPPSPNSTVNLINLMVKRHLISPDDASDLIQQAEKEAATAQATAAQVASAAPGNSDGSGGGGGGSASDGDSVSVNYIPDTVRQQMQSEIEQDVVTKAREENWATPNAFPTWASRMNFFGDTRFRVDEQFFPKGNATNGAFYNFNSINTGSPLNNIAGTPTPFYDVDKDRERLRLRARFGVDVQLDEGFTAGLRLATGSDDSPVTENQTLGGANNGQGGNFGKYQIWLDRAFLSYQYGTDPDHTFSVTVGRFENPFMHTSMIFADDLGFDGAVVKGKYKVDDGVTPFLVGGAFPVFNTDLNFASTNPSKFTSTDKWLFATQAGTTWQINDDYSFKGAVSYYDYESVQGKLSDPFIPLTSSDQGNTDDTRPSFAQNGNTYFPVRDIDNSTAANDFGAADQYEYYGLASAFHELAFTGQLDFNHFDPFHVQLSGEVVKNVAFDKGYVDSVAINNLGTGGSFEGGDMGYMMKLRLGAPALLKRWDWNVELTYRYVQTDAVVDGFTDSDFGGVLAGTNLQGYTIGGNVAFTPNVWAGLRWMSADAIAGPTYKNDLLQFDINSKF